MTLLRHLCVFLALGSTLPRSQGAETPSTTQLYPLKPDATWQLNLPDLEPFEASALLLTPEGHLLTVNNRGPEVYQIRLPEQSGAADLTLDLLAFPKAQLLQIAPTPRGRYDSEGLARDSQGRLYLCEESHRYILRYDPHWRRVQRLDIDWTPVQSFFSQKNANASFEGIAVGDNRLYVANERQAGRIIVVDLNTLRVLESWEVRTHRNNFWDAHYSDLSWYDGRLYVLCRESRAILRVHPKSHAVEAEYDFASIELNPEWRYRTRVPLVGVMEGLAVDAHHIWLVTDNNNQPRERHPDDRRPTLFRCPRPDQPSTGLRPETSVAKPPTEGAETSKGNR